MNNSRILPVVTFASLAVLVIIIGISPVFAQVGGPANPNANVTTANKLNSPNNYPITVSTDKQSYVTNDVITISGIGYPNLTTTQYLAGIPTPIISKNMNVNLKIMDSAGNLISIKQLIMDDSGKYSTTVSAIGDLWKNPGLYTVIAQQGNYNNAQTQFWFNYNGGSTSEHLPPSSSVVPPSTSEHLPPSSSVVPPSTSEHLPPSSSVVPPSTSEHLPPSSTITSPSIPAIPSTTPSKIPSWVRHIFIYYGQGDVSEDELLNAIKFLVNQGIMKLS